MNRLLIARHGNTFKPGEVPVRVGLRTDIPLAESGCAQAVMLGKFLRKNYPNLSAVYSSKLKRGYQTACLAVKTAKLALDVLPQSQFDEVDYDVDEGKTDEAIISRIGKESLLAWESENMVPAGWRIDCRKIVQNWRDFARKICKMYPGQTVLVVTSNGIARYAPHLTGNFKAFRAQYSLKISTGAISSLVKENQDWIVEYWNIKPDDSEFQ